VFCSELIKAKLTKITNNREVKMICPCCPETNLVLSERQGIEIDYCPKCRGIWLDRGELDKILEKTQDIPQAPKKTEFQDSHQRQDNYYNKSHKRKKSFLEEIFD
jgi:Zn-finger nucleic acid-binding protein